MSSKMSKSVTEFSKNTKKNVYSWVDKIFQDACQKNWKGQIVRGPGIWCGLWIFLIVMGTIGNIVISWRLVDYDVSKTQILIQNLIDIIISMVVIYFVIRMCYICRGWTALAVVIIFNMVFAALRLKFFSSYSMALQDLAKDSMK